MLDAIVRFSVRHRFVVVALGLILLGYGLYIASRSRLDVFPEFAPPLVVVQTEAPGFSPEQVEQLVTHPIEVELGGLPGLKTIRSQSIQGLSVVTTLFQDGTDIYRNRQLVTERLGIAARSLPPSVHPPTLTPLTSSTSMILITGLQSDRLDARQLRTYVDYDLKPALLSVPGVAGVLVFGGEVPQLELQLDPQKLKAYGMSFREVVKSLSRSTAIRGAGFIETPNQRIILLGNGQLSTPEELGNAVARRSRGLTVRFKDLGRFVMGSEPKFGDAQIHGRPAILVEVTDQYGANTLQVTQAVERAYRRIAPDLKKRGITVIPNIFRPANFIRTSISDVRSSMLLGGALVILVLFLFLWNFRVSLISMSAIPLSLLSSVVLLNLFGLSLNTLTLGGLAIAIGEVVDDAVIDVENIFRRLRENLGSNQPVSRLKTVFQASVEVRHSVVYATFIVILVFYPVLKMSGLEGKLFAPLGYAYIFSILASLLIALTITPALSAILLHDRTLAHGEPRWLQAFKSFYQNHVRWVMENPKKTLAMAILLFSSSLAMIPYFSGSFLPEFHEGHYIVHMSAIPGTSLPESMRLGREVTLALEKLPFVRSVAQQVGRTELTDDVYGPHYSEIQVDLKPMGGDEEEKAQGEIRKTLAQFPGLTFSIKPFLTERIEETLSGVTAGSAVKIIGNDLDALDRAARDVDEIVSRTPGAEDVRFESVPTLPELQISLKPQTLAAHGFQSANVLDAIQTAYQGTIATQVHHGIQSMNVVAILNPQDRMSPESLGELTVRNPDGAWFPLKDLADIRLIDGRYSIFHEGERREQTVSFDIEGRDSSAFTRDLRSRLSPLSNRYPGLSFELVGTSEAQAKAQSDLLMHSLIAAGGIVLLLGLVLGSGKNLALVLLNLPFALVGGVFAVFATGGLINLGSLVGFVSLFGISTRNSIMLISHYEHLVSKENASWNEETVIRGATDRFVPILMTATVTALGLLPIALGSGDPGREIEGPMAIVILGGLITSTALNLLILPALSHRFARFKMHPAESTQL